ncbi:MAG: PrsW family intramembrane metalloprotease [Asgard group archaeon]|nr:PrsW family intramembrane metalloprotease [Asgard group archaeon]
MATVMDTILAIITITVPLLGGAFTVFMFYKRDLEKEPKRLVFTTFLWGLVAGGLIIGITVPMFVGIDRLIAIIGPEWGIILTMIGAVLIQVVIEESIKYYIFYTRCFCLISEVDGLYDGFFYGAIIGTGAGVVDAIIFAILSTDWLEGLRIAIIKTIRIPGTQAFFTGLIGAYCAWNRLKGRKRYPGILYAVALHSIWNISTFLIYYFLEEQNWSFYAANYTLMIVYIVFMIVISGLMIKYDIREFPEAVTNDAKVQGKCKIKK